MPKTKVIVSLCPDYDEKNVYDSISGGLKALGGIGSFVLPGEKILIKPNFLSPSEADKAATTHPSVIKAACRILAEEGYGQVLVGDSPANGSCKAALEKLHLTEGDLSGAQIVDMAKAKEIQFPEGRTCKSFFFAQEVTEAEAIIGLSKMKTHMLERITGAVKNMYGLICGKHKAAGHVAFPTDVKFAKMLADIHRATPQRLHIMDAVTAMEGNGPGSGTPKHMGMILLSADPVALDTVFCWLVDLRPELVPTNVQGELAGIGTCNEEQIEIVLLQDGVDTVISKDELVKGYAAPDFDVQRSAPKMNPLSLLSKLAGGGRRPVIDEDKCVRCGVCVDHCPVEGGAVNFSSGRDNPPQYDYTKCIRCYCCQELCPQKAIHVKI